MSTLDPISGTNQFTLAYVLAHNPLRGRDFLSIDDVTGVDLELILAASQRLKNRRRSMQHRADEYRMALDGRHVALLFEKPSLRTRTTFEVATNELGGSAIVLGPDEVGLESAKASLTSRCVSSDGLTSSSPGSSATPIF